MPIGSYANLYYIAKELETRKPKSVLDLGVGFGMNGVLVRQYLDLGMNNNTHLIGVEAFTEYTNPVWHLYDKIFGGTISEYANLFCRKGETQYDCILMTDVIEHFHKENGYATLALLPGILNPGGFILISTPGVFVEQGAVNGNEFERHLSFWGWADFPPGYTILKSGKDHHGDETTIALYEKGK